MKERPILFSTPMVQSILEDRKKVTRRIIKNIPDDIKGEITWGYSCFTPKGYISLRTKFKTDKGHHYGEKFFKLPFCKGDILWVRETWGKNFDDTFFYKADIPFPPQGGWKPSIFMPKVACRIKLEVTNIRVEQLHEISEVDAKAEGVAHVIDKITGYCGYDYLNDSYNLMITPYHGFRSLWKKINGKESWDSNPYVWVIEFKKITQ